jgi:hypothetical protein
MTHTTRMSTAHTRPSNVCFLISRGEFKHDRLLLLLYALAHTASKYYKPLDPTLQSAEGIPKLCLGKE